MFRPFPLCVITTLRTGGLASDQCRIYRSFSCQSWPEVGRLLILCHAAPHSGDASQQSGCSIMSSLPSIPGLLWGNFLPWLPSLWPAHNPLVQDFYCNYKHQECLANIFRLTDALIVNKLGTFKIKNKILLSRSSVSQFDFDCSVFMLGIFL